MSDWKVAVHSALTAAVATVLCAGANRLPGKETAKQKVPLCGMQIEKAADDEVVTTGARFVIDPKTGTITCFQRLYKQRELGAATIQGASLEGLRVVSKDLHTAVLKGKEITLRFELDSTVWIDEPGEASFALKSAFLSVKNPGGAYIHDGRGGFGRQVMKSKKRSWPVLYVQPPRPYDQESYTRVRFASFGRWYPSEAQLRATKQQWHFNTVRLHYERAMKTGRSPTAPNELANEKELKRVIADAHRLGLKVILYAGYSDRIKDVEEYLKQRGPENYYRWGFDGLYFDSGLYYPSGYHTYRLFRGYRERFPDKIIYQHGPRARPTDLCFNYADFMCTGEHQDWPTPEGLKAYIRDSVAHRYRTGTIGMYIAESRWGRPKWVIDEVLANHCRFYSSIGGVGNTKLKNRWTFGRGTYARWREGYFHPKLDLRALELDRRTGRINQADFDRASARIRAGIAQFQAKEKELAETGKVPLGYPAKVRHSPDKRMPKEEKWLACSYPRWDYGPHWAVDGSVTSGVWIGGVRFTWRDSAEHRIEKARKSFLRIDLQKVVPIGRILYDTHYPVDRRDIWQEAFQILASADGKEWKAVVAKSGLKGPERLEFKVDVRARYLKVTGIVSHNQDEPNWRFPYVTEIQAYEK